MSILGTLIDRTTVSRAGDALGSAGQGVTLTTLAHSLPATNPEAVFMNLRSHQEVGGAQGQLQLVGLGGNASLLTIGYVAGSQASSPTVMFDVVATVFYSSIR